MVTLLLLKINVRAHLAKSLNWIMERAESDARYDVLSLTLPRSVLTQILH